MRFGVREICNVVFKATVKDQQIGEKKFAKGEPVIYFDSLKTSTMEQATTTVYAQGGRGNTRLVAWEGEKTLTFTMEDALISEMGLAILAGARLWDADSTKGNTIVAHVSEIIPDLTTGVSNLKSKAEGITAYALPLDENGEVCGKAVVATITEEAGANKKYPVTATFEDGVTAKAVLVDYYIDKSTGATQIDIEPECFGGNFYIEADTLFRDTNGADHAAQFVIPNGKIQSNFTLTMASSGDPSTFTFTVDAFPGYVNGDITKKVLSTIQILDDKEVSGVNDPAGDKEDSKPYEIGE